MAKSLNEQLADRPVNRERVEAHKERLLAEVGGELALEYVTGDQRVQVCRGDVERLRFFATHHRDGTDFSTALRSPRGD